MCSQYGPSPDSCLVCRTVELLAPYVARGMAFSFLLFGMKLLTIADLSSVEWTVLSSANVQSRHLFESFLVSGTPSSRKVCLTCTKYSLNKGRHCCVNPAASLSKNGWRRDFSPCLLLLSSCRGLWRRNLLLHDSFQPLFLLIRNRGLPSQFKRG